MKKVYEFIHKAFTPGYKVIRGLLNDSVVHSSVINSICCLWWESRGSVYISFFCKWSAQWSGNILCSTPCPYCPCCGYIHCDCHIFVVLKSQPLLFNSLSSAPWCESNNKKKGCCTQNKACCKGWGWPWESFIKGWKR